MKCLFSINICENMLHYRHSHTKLSNEILLTCPQQDLLCMPHLFSMMHVFSQQVNYFLNKQH